MSRNLKVISICDRSYNSYEQSEAKIFIIWAIIKHHMINHKMSYDRSRWFMSDQSILWVIVLLSFDVPPMIYLLLYIQEQKSQGYSCIWSIIQLQWVIRSQNFHHLSDHKMSYDQSRWFMSDQCNLWANSAHRVFFVQFLSSCLEISCLHIPSDNNYRIFIYFSMSIHKMCLSDQTCIN